MMVVKKITNPKIKLGLKIQVQLLQMQILN